MTTEEATPREAARILLFDSSDRVLLLRGHDPYLPERSWWFTPGGGLHPGETHREAAAREVREETGFVVSTEALTGPVWERTAIFDFMNNPYVQHEEFFLARTADATGQDEVLFTESEIDTIERAQWLRPKEIMESDIEVFPLALGELLSTVLPWDGVLRHLGREEA